MRILVAGATGAVGRPLLRMLNERGHDVVGTTRSEERTGLLRGLGAEPIVCDALDADAVHQAIARCDPLVIINQLTALSAPLNPRRYMQWLEPTNRLRAEGTRNLTKAAAAAGTRLLVSQSMAFAYRWEGTALKTEDDPLFDADMGFGRAATALRELERRTLNTPSLDGVVLRYGYFYGPGTSYANDGDIAELVRRRRFPLVGSGTGQFSFIHVDDAASATVAAIERGKPGTWNVVDDEPAEMKAWLPHYAQALGAKPPRRVPLWLARLATSRFVAEAAVRQRGASNARIKRDLEWAPRWSSWRQGFLEALG
jgi:nucleoside-diphosphate-sugar epimerase